MRFLVEVTQFLKWWMIVTATAATVIAGCVCLILAVFVIGVFLSRLFGDVGIAIGLFLLATFTGALLLRGMND